MKIVDPNWRKDQESLIPLHGQESDIFSMTGYLLEWFWSENLPAMLPIIDLLWRRGGEGRHYRCLVQKMNEKKTVENEWNFNKDDVMSK